MMRTDRPEVLLIVVLCCLECSATFRARFWDPNERKYGSFSQSKRLELLEETRQMFAFGYDNYMKYAFPKDELDPIHCTGRGPDYGNPYDAQLFTLDV